MSIKERKSLLEASFKRLLFAPFFLLIGINCVHAQCAEPDASIWLDTWVSCEKKQNPKAAYGSSHWIQYDLGSIRALSKTWIWNTNDPNRLDQGFKQVKIDYSSDGKNWNSWGEMSFPKAEGKAVYGGFSGPDLRDIEARYVLFTAISTHGSNCAGLAEVKFNLSSSYIENNGDSFCEVLPPVDLISVEDIDEEEALIFWQYDIPERVEEAIYFSFEFREEGSLEWTVIDTDEPDIYLEELNPGTKYEFRILSGCEESTQYSAIQSFTTLRALTTDTEELKLNADRVNIYPNPTLESITLNYFSEKGGELDYVILDMQGRSLFRGRRSINPGNNNFRINLSNLEGGVYMIDAKSSTNKLRIVKRIVKIDK